MSVTYPADPLKPYGDRVELNPNVDGASDEPFVPVYARTGKSTRRNGGKIKTWMILTPVGIIVLAGLGAVALGGGDQTTAPLAEPAATAPVVSATPLAAPVVSAVTPAPVVRTAPTPAPVLRPAAPVRRAAAAPAPTRRSTTVVAAPRSTAPAPVARTVTPVPAASSPTPMLNMAPMAPMAPTAAPAPVPAAPQSPPPFVIVEPVG